MNDKTHAASDRSFDLCDRACRSGCGSWNGGCAGGDQRGGSLRGGPGVPVSGRVRGSRLRCSGVGFIVMKPYRLARAIDFVDKDHKLLAKIDPHGRILEYAKKTASTSDPGYQQRQAKIAVGSGGLTGLGLMESKQKMLYLPEAHTDFIYGVVGEETGLLGCGFLLLGFLVVLWRGMRMYFHAADDFGRYLALSVTVCVVVMQALINISVVLDLVPNKGIPLPFISYGGSSLLSTLLLMGMLLSVSEHAA